MLRCASDNFRHLRLCGILAKGTKQIAKCLARNRACALLVEEREGLLVFWRLVNSSKSVRLEWCERSHLRCRSRRHTFR